MFVTNIFILFLYQIILVTVFGQKDSCNHVDSEDVTNESCDVANEAVTDSEQQVLHDWVHWAISRQYLRSEPELDSLLECDDVKMDDLVSCSWGQCQSDYTGQGNVSLADGSIISGR